MSECESEGEREKGESQREEEMEMARARKGQSEQAIAALSNASTIFHHLFTTHSAMHADEARLKSFVELLQPGSPDVCELYSLRHLCLQPGGIPSGSGSGSSNTQHSLRAQAWRVLLGLLPPEKQEWSSTLAKRRDDYSVSCDSLLPIHASPDLSIRTALCLYHHSKSFSARARRLARSSVS